MPTVGEILAAERRRQGKSLNDAVEGTKIRSRLLDALENGRYDELPSPAYVKGFIQSYAHYLEVPSEPLLQQYRLEASGHSGHVSPADRYLSAIPAETIVPDRERAHAIPRNVWIAAVVALAVVLLIACALMRLLGGSGGTGTLPSTTPSNTESASPGATGSPTATTTIGVAPEGFKLRLTVREGLASSVKVTVDGLVALDRTLEGGESREWRVNEACSIVVGNPRAIVVTRDGKAVTIPTKANSRVDLTAE